jgi:uncharacterized protein
MKKYSFLDPIHGNIELSTSNAEEQLILNLIETTEFQRLRRIRQLGFSYLTFYGAEGTRFVHSIGAFQVARRMLNELNLQYSKLVSPHRTSILVAALLHDLGHGPFSHSSEGAFGFQHEEWTLKNILGATEVNQVLTGFDKKLPATVLNLLRGEAPEPWMAQVVSGQLDCDRADYLIRDSHQTGTTYGVFQLDRIIKSLELAEVEGKMRLLINEKGIQAVEDYLFARYSMYLQVYHHKKTLSADALFISLIARAKDLLQSGQLIPVDPSLKKWLSPLKTKISLNEFWEVDDVSILQHLKLWSKQSADTILADLAGRMLNRNLFKAQKLDQLSKAEVQAIKKKTCRGNEKYYCLIKECKEFPYSDSKKTILVRKSGKVIELSKASGIATALMNKGKELDVKWLFAPRECFE